MHHEFYKLGNASATRPSSQLVIPSPNMPLSAGPLYLTRARAQLPCRDARPIIIHGTPAANGYQSFFSTYIPRQYQGSYLIQVLQTT